MSIDAPSEVLQGANFVVRVDITEVSNMAASQFDLIYDPSVIQVIGAEAGIEGVTSGQINSTTWPIDMWMFNPIHIPGVVRIIGHVNPIFSVSGSGYLAEVHFNVIGSIGSVSNLTLANIMLSNNNSEAIEPVATNGWAVEVSFEPLQVECNATPDPAKIGHPVNFSCTLGGGVPPYSYAWDFNNDGIVDSTVQNPAHTYNAVGNYMASVTVTDSQANSEECFTEILVYMRGDANGDGNVNMMDVTKVEWIILQLASPTPGADANEDGVIDIRDVSEIERIILGF